MNILFLEDEVELSAIGVEQLRKLGHVVYPALDISEARDVVDEHWQTLHLIIADHRLPDGAGIDYLMEVKQLYPRIKLAVVSGCLSAGDEENLRMAEIPFFTKPLLYRQVMQKLREHYMITTRPPMKTPSAPPMKPPSPPTPPSAGGNRVPPPAANNPIPPNGGASKPKPTPIAGEGLLAKNGVDTTPPMKKKGLTSVIFSKLTGKD